MPEQPAAARWWILKASSVWLAMLVLAVANGALRVAVLIPRLGEPAGHVISTLVLSALIAALTWATIRWVAPPSKSGALAIGALWVTLTLAFEFGFGRLVAHRSWAELLADYDVAKGRIWILVLLTTGVAPYVAARFVSQP